MKKEERLLTYIVLMTMIVIIFILGSLLTILSGGLSAFKESISNFILVLILASAFLNAMFSFLSAIEEVKEHKNNLSAGTVLVLFYGMVPVLALSFVPVLGYLISVKLYHRIILKLIKPKNSPSHSR